MKQDNNSDSKYIIPNLQNALELIELISEYPEGLNLPKLVQMTKVPKSTIFRICSTLIANGYLEKDPESGHFILTRKILRIGLSALGEESLIEKALPPMRKLRDQVSETVLLGTLMDNDIALLEQVTGNHPFTFILKPGSHFVLHASAPGKAMLAFVQDEEREALLNSIEFTKFNERTIVTKEGMMREISIIREQGYAVDRAEELEGVHCVASPIFDQHNHPIAVVWTTGPSVRLKANEIEKTGNLVIECAEKISANFGYKV
ncbi:MAG: IclR family transcriptional regulator [Cytophagales bacterium]|nr:IclR family transcriptional regulator [Cytophagales bacterium]